MTNQEVIDILRDHYRNATMAGSPEAARKNNLAIDRAILAIEKSHNEDVLEIITKEQAQKMVHYAEEIGTTQMLRFKDFGNPNWELTYGVRKR